jgi:hypothetical protein
MQSCHLTLSSERLGSCGPVTLRAADCIALSSDAQLEEAYRSQLDLFEVGYPFQRRQELSIKH